MKYIVLHIKSFWVIFVVKYLFYYQKNSLCLYVCIHYYALGL